MDVRAREFGGSWMVRETNGIQVLDVMSINHVSYGAAAGPFFSDVCFEVFADRYDQD